MNTPLVSVIIPTKNSAFKIEKTLLSVKNQNYSRSELIVCDNFSSDDTIGIVKKFKARIFQKGPERSSQKNFGALKAKGKYLLFLDSDAELEGKVIDECVRKAESESLEMIIVPEKNVGVGYWAQVKSLERQFYLGDNNIEAPWFFNREAFFAVGGYNTQMYAGEDWDLFERMKKRRFGYGRINSYILHDINRITLGKILRKKFYYALNIRAFIRRNPKTSLNKSPLMRKAIVKNIGYLFKKPYLYTGLVVVNFLELVVISFGVLISFFKND